VSRADALESAHRLEAPGDTDAVTFAWADPAAELYGMARLGRSAADDGSLESSTLCVVFAGHAPVAVFARGGETLPAGGWDGLQLAGLATGIEVPLERWALSGGGDAPFSLEFQATAPPAELPAASAITRAGGLAGYAQLCRVRGSIRVDGHERRLDGFGQRSHAWGNRPWQRIALTRSLGIWFADGTGVLFGSVRSTDAHAHADEASGASLVGPGGDVVARDARLSTTSDGDGRQRRAGLELYLAEDGPPHHAAGETLCGATLDLGPVRLDCAFLRWHMEGREGVGRYDVLRTT
jgi:hypothetical protein